MNVKIITRKIINIYRSDIRTFRIALTATSSAFSRVLAMLVPLIVVRISLQKLGAETYGLWMTVTSFFSLFTFADLGLGSGLQTKLSRLYGSDRGEEAQMLISSAYIVLGIVSTTILIIFCILFVNLDWANIMNAESRRTAESVGVVVLAVVLSKIANIPLGLVQRVQFAFQEGYISNIWNCASSVLSLLSVYVLAKLTVNPIFIIWGSSLAPVLIALINHIYYFHFEHAEFKPVLSMFSKAEAYEVLGIGIQFMLLSILTTVSLSMDSYIVARTCGLDSVTPYSIGYRIATVMSVATTMLSMPLWSANGEALAKKDYSWVRKITKKMSQISLLITLIGSALFLIFGNWIVDIWLNNSVKIPMLLMSGLLFMQVVQAFVSPYFMVLNGAGVIRKQIILFSFYTPIAIVIKYIFSIKFGVSVIPWIGAIMYMVIIVVPTYKIAENIYKS